MNTPVKDAVNFRKVLFLCHEFPPVGGGAGRTAYNLARILVSRGYSVYILTCKYNKFEIEKIDGVKFIHVPGFRKSELQNTIAPTFFSFLLFGYIKAKRIIREEKINLIHSFMTVPAGIVGYWLKKKYSKDCKHIISLLGSDVPFHTKNTVVEFLRNYIVKVWVNADSIVALSKGTRRTAAKTFPNAEEKMDVIYSGISFQPNEKAKSDLYLPDNKIKLVTLSRLIKLKGIDDVIEALHKLDISGKLCDFEYFIIGSGPEKDNLQQKIKELGLENKITLMGFLSEDQIIKTFERANFFILTSYSEALGMVYLEALAAGLPVIGTNTGGVPEIISNDVGLLVEPGNIDEIAFGILKMSSKYYSYPQKVLLDKARTFSWESISDQYKLIYDKVLENKDGVELIN